MDDETSRRTALAFFCLVACSPGTDAEDIIRKSAEGHEPAVTRGDVAWVRGRLFPHPDWLPAELELCRILGV